MGDEGNTTPRDQSWGITAEPREMNGALKEDLFLVNNSFQLPLHSNTSLQII
jgi:hypothetical protein